MLQLEQHKLLLITFTLYRHTVNTVDTVHKKILMNARVIYSDTRKTLYLAWHSGNHSWAKCCEGNLIGDICMEFLETEVIPLITNLFNNPVYPNTTFFFMVQQDGASLHSRIPVKEYLNTVFPNRGLSRTSKIGNNRKDFTNPLCAYTRWYCFNGYHLLSSRDRDMTC